MGKISTIKQRGFTLIEMCIVILIIGILTVAFIQSYEIYNEKRLMELTDLKFNDINQAMERYAERNGRLPCPGPRLVGGADRSMYGEEVCGGIDSGVITVNNAAGTPVAFIGMLPAVELGLSSDYLKDGHNRSLIYAVSIGLTAETPMTTVGALQLEERTLIYDEAAGVTEEVTKTYDEVQYVVVSAGRRSDGGFSVTGNRIGDCSADNGLDFENCNDDLLFVAAYRSDAQTTQSFDDRVIFAESIALIEEEEEATTCLEKTSFYTYADTCPDGWAVDSKGVATNIVPASESRIDIFSYGSGVRPSSDIGEYYNVDPETGDYYFTNKPTEFTVAGGDPNVGKSMFDSTIDKTTIKCVKPESNSATTKCFGNEFKIRAPSSFTNGYLTKVTSGGKRFQVKKEPSPEVLATYCPEGLRYLGYDKGTVYRTTSSGGAIDSSGYESSESTTTIAADTIEIKCGE